MPPTRRGPNSIRFADVLVDFTTDASSAMKSLATLQQGSWTSHTTDSFERSVPP